MKREHIEDDDISIITRIVEERLRYFRCYSGEVKKLNNDGSVTIHSEEFGTDEADTRTHLIAFTGSQLANQIPPKKSDKVIFGFPNGTPDKVYYYSLDPAYQRFRSNWADQMIIHRFSEASFVYDIANQEYILLNGILPPEKMVKGETLKTQLEALVTAIDSLVAQIALITVPVISLGAPSGVPNNAAAISAISGTITAIKATFELFLSEGNKTN